MTRSEMHRTLAGYVLARWRSARSVTILDGAYWATARAADNEDGFDFVLSVADVQRMWEPCA